MKAFGAKVIFSEPLDRFRRRHKALLKLSADNPRYTASLPDQYNNPSLILRPITTLPEPR